ncbi:MAG: 50S ribosomal protein L9 [Rickettsiales bacterium]|nr:50S ribosomal protein L9 [Rickettsiales bacterium]
MEIILLERIGGLGNVGDVVSVKNGYARNYLIPENRALRATKANKDYFEAQRDALEKQNAERKAEAEKRAKTLEGITVTVVRQAADDGKLYGSVAVRDVADALQADGHDVERRIIDLADAIKTIGLHKASIRLHPEVEVEIRVHVARNADSPIPEELIEETQEEEVEVVAAGEAEIEPSAEAVEAAADAEPAGEDASEEEDKDSSAA